MRATLAFDGLNCVSAKMAKATFYPYRKSFTRFFFHDSFKVRFFIHALVFSRL